MNNIDVISSIRDQMLDKKEEYRRKEKDLSKVIGYIDCIIDLLDIIIKMRKGGNK